MFADEDFKEKEVEASVLLNFDWAEVNEGLSRQVYIPRFTYPSPRQVCIPRFTYPSPRQVRTPTLFRVYTPS